MVFNSNNTRHGRQYSINYHSSGNNTFAEYWWWTVNSCRYWYDKQSLHTSDISPPDRWIEIICPGSLLSDLPSILTYILGLYCHPIFTEGVWNSIIDNYCKIKIFTHVIMTSGCNSTQVPIPSVTNTVSIYSAQLRSKINWL
jgi:hypothetical protein